MIGIIGAYGEIGKNVTNLLKENYSEKLLLGGRNVKQALSNEKGLDDCELMNIDIEDSISMEKFIKKCNVVVNCSGKNGYITKCITKYKSKYIDAGLTFNKMDYEGLETVLYGVGAIPGLSGILSKYLSLEFDMVESLEFYYKALGKFSLTAAKDYLDGIASSDNKSMTFLQNGKLVNFLGYENEINKFIVRSGVNRGKCYPFYDKETQHIVEKLNLKNGKWFSLLDGELISKILERSSYDYKINPKETIKNLSQASIIDSSINTKYAMFIIQESGFVGDEYLKKTLTLEAEDPSRLTGAVLAMAAICVNDGIIACGQYPLWECTHTKYAVRILKSLDKSIKLNLYNNSINELFKEQEGEI